MRATTPLPPGGKKVIILPPPVIITSPGNFWPPLFVFLGEKNPNSGGKSNLGNYPPCFVVGCFSTPESNPMFV